MTVEAPEVFELTFMCPDRPLSENEARGMHWARARDRLAPWKHATQIAWLQNRDRHHLIVGRPCKVRMVIPFASNRRRDPSNWVGTVTKVCVDTLVATCRVWPDDTPEWVEVLEPELVIGKQAAIRLFPKGPAVA